MSILSIVRDYGTNPSIVRMTTDDSVAVMSAPGYLASQMPSFNRVNSGSFQFSVTDMILTYTTVQNTWNFFTITPNGSGFTPYPGPLPVTPSADSVLITDNASTPTWLANSGTPGYVLTANAGAPPSWQAGGGGAGAVLLVPSANQVITGPYTLQATNFVSGYSTTATAGGTTVLTVGSTNQQYFTGVLSQTVTLPVTSTLVLGFQFTIVNNSTGTITVNSSGSNLVEAMQPQTQLVVTCVLTSGTSAASWDTDYTADILPVVLAPLANQTITGGFDLVVDSGGNIQASSGALVTGSSGLAGELIIFPPTAGRGFLQVHAGNSAAAFNGLLTNLSLSASRTWSLPDSDGTIALVGAASSIALTGDTGTCTGAALTVFANQAAFNCGSSVSFDNSGTTSTLNVTDIGSNTVIGSSAGSLLSGSSSNCALGIAALASLVSGSFNLAVGSFAGSNFTGTENNNICINSNGVIGDNHTLRIGGGTNTFPQGLMTTYIHGVYSNTQPISGTVDYVTIDNTTGLMGVTSIAAPVGAVLLSPAGTQTITSNDLVLAAGDMYSTVGGFISGDPAGGSFGYFSAFPVGGNTLGSLQLECTNNVGAFTNVITNNPTTAPRTWSFPDADGTVALVGGGDNWVDQTTASITMVTRTGYTSNAGASLITFTLPTSASVGDFIEINGLGSGLWTIAQAAGQQIQIAPNATTLGVGGSLSSVNQYDNVRLRCIVADTIWTVVSQQDTGLTRV